MKVFASPIFLAAAAAISPYFIRGALGDDGNLTDIEEEIGRAHV